MFFRAFALIAEDDAEIGTKAKRSVEIMNESLASAVRGSIQPDSAMVVVGGCYNIRPGQISKSQGSFKAFRLKACYGRGPSDRETGAKGEYCTPAIWYQR